MEIFIEQDVRWLYIAVDDLPRVDVRVFANDLENRAFDLEAASITSWLKAYLRTVGSSTMPIQELVPDAITRCTPVLVVFDYLDVRHKGRKRS